MKAHDKTRLLLRASAALAGLTGLGLLLYGAHQAQPAPILVGGLAASAAPLLLAAAQPVDDEPSDKKKGN